MHTPTCARVCLCLRVSVCKRACVHVRLCVHECVSGTNPYDYCFRMDAASRCARDCVLIVLPNTVADSIPKMDVTHFKITRICVKRIVLENLGHIMMQ